MHRDPLLSLLMNLAKNAFASVQSSQHSTYSIFKRIVNLALVIAAVAICVNLWLLSTEQAQNWYAKQASQLGRSLSMQGALSLAPVMADNNSERIGAYLQHLTQDQHVDSAAVFGQRGQLITSTQDNLSLLTNFQVRQDLPLVFVQEVIYEEQIKGYLRILLNEDKIMQYHGAYQQQLFEQTIVLMLLSAVAGLLATRAFYKFRYRHYQFVSRSKTND